MTRELFETIAHENTGLKEVVSQLINYMGSVLDGGYPTFHSFITRHITDIHIHTHSGEGDALPSSKPNELYFLSWVNISTLDVNIAQSTSKVQVPLAVFKEAIGRTEKDQWVCFGNLFIVNHVPSRATGNFSITIHKYPGTFFQTLVLVDPQLLGHVVQKRIRINGTQLELPRETLLSEFVD